MLLAFDIGNTSISIGIFKGTNFINKWSLPSDIAKSADDYAIDIVEFFLNNKIDCLNISSSIIASVVPTLTNTINEAVEKFTSASISHNTLIVGNKNVKLNILNKADHANEVGHDRLVNSIAGFEKFGGNLVIIDFGTATTFDVVGKDGEYLGGVISPGINLSLKTLHDMTAQLPKITVKSQKNVIGKTTIEAMNSGVYFGYISLIEGIIKRIDEELGCKTTKIITGGLGDIFKNALRDLIQHYEPGLTLEGLRIIYEKNSNPEK